MDESLSSIEACFDRVYAACARDADGSWRRDLDVASSMGAISAGYEHEHGTLQLDELLGCSVLRDATEGLLRLARARCCFRGVLLETLGRRGPEHGEYARWEGHAQMLQLLRRAKLAATDAEFKSLLWFLGQAEYHCRGRLWAPAHGGRLMAPSYLCALARGSEWRVQALASVFGHSAVLREPLRRFLDANWQEFVAKAWRQAAPDQPWLKMSYIVGWPELQPGDVDDMQDHTDAVTSGSYAYGLDGFLRRMCPILARVAIGLPMAFASPQLSLALLAALRHISCARDAFQETLEQLRLACQVRSLAPREESALSKWLARDKAFGGRGTGVRPQLCWLKRDACPAAAITFLLDAIAPYIDGSPFEELAPSPPPRLILPTCSHCMTDFLDLPTDIDDDGVEYRYDDQRACGSYTIHADVEMTRASFRDWYRPNYRQSCCKYTLLWAPFAFP